MPTWHKTPPDVCFHDVGAFCYTCWCPCFAFKEAAENMGEGGNLFCLATTVGCGCCVLTSLGQRAAKTQGISAGLCQLACLAMCNAITCYSCVVVHESRVIKAKTVATVQGQEIER
jgi:hypothetical protein